jgi:hypothetical protein
LAPSKPSASNKEKEERQGAAPDPTTALTAALEIFTDDWKELNLHGKIAAISGYLGRIPKNGHNKFNDYWYVLESDLVEAIRWYLAAAKILIFPEMIREHTVYTFTDHQLGQGERRRDILTDNIVVYRVVDGKNGESFTFEVNGQGSDPRDKGSNKASTSAMKFAYLRLFNIASGEDSESDTKGDTDAAAGAQPPVTVVPSNVEGAQRGGKQELATGAQIKAVSALSNQTHISGPELAAVIKKITGTEVPLPEDPAQHGPAFLVVLKAMKGEEIGKVIYALQETAKAVGDTGSGYGD